MTVLVLLSPPFLRWPPLFPPSFCVRAPPPTHSCEGHVLSPCRVTLGGSEMPGHEGASQTGQPWLPASAPGCSAGLPAP